MAPHPHAWGAVAIALLLALAALLWRQARPAAGAVRLSRMGDTFITQPIPPAHPMHSTARPQEGAGADPLLAPGLRHTLEMLLLEAGGASDPLQLKQRLAERMGTHFPAALAVRALALAKRYVDYRVALGLLEAPPDAGDAGALRAALQARQALRLQFFDGPEHAALFAQEEALDRYALARIEALLEPGLGAGQRALALRAAQALLPAEKIDEYRATSEHLAAAAQTAGFDARDADPATRHAARSARWGGAAAQALAALDREEQHWQQRLGQYGQALAQPGRDGAALQQLRQQLFSAEEQPRIDAALALRRMAGEAAQ